MSYHGASSKSIELISGHTNADFTREQYMNAEFKQTKRDMQKVPSSTKTSSSSRMPYIKEFDEYACQIRRFRQVTHQIS